MKAILKRLIPSHIWPSAIAGRWICGLAAKQGVISGPFKGMKYGMASVGSALAPKVLGVYEMELHAILNELKNLSIGKVVDVGAAEGYYAIGSALYWPECEVTAFEAEQEGQRLLNENAILNGVKGRLSIHGSCTPNSLLGVLASEGPALLIMDVEGFEIELLTPDVARALRRWHVIVELHDCYVSNASKDVASVMGKTHSLRVIGTEQRRFRDFKGLGTIKKLLLFRYLKMFAREFRPGPMSWIYAVPKNS